MPASDSLHDENQVNHTTKASCVTASKGIHGGGEANLERIPEYAMAPVKIIHSAMPAASHESGFEYFTRTTLTAETTTNGRRVKPIAMSIGMDGIGPQLTTDGCRFPVRGWNSNSGIPLTPAVS